MSAEDEHTREVEDLKTREEMLDEEKDVRAPVTASACETEAAPPTARARKTEAAPSAARDAAQADEPVAFAADSPFANETVARLLEKQGHAQAAHALRETLARTHEPGAQPQRRALREIAAACPGCRGIALLDAGGVRLVHALDSKVERTLGTHADAFARIFATAHATLTLASGSSSVPSPASPSPSQPSPSSPSASPLPSPSPPSSSPSLSPSPSSPSSPPSASPLSSSPSSSPSPPSPASGVGEGFEIYMRGDGGQWLLWAVDAERAVLLLLVAEASVARARFQLRFVASAFAPVTRDAHPTRGV